ncbi:Panacea domain-containing protein [Planococcus sp. 107-1]|uniref:Panacea domain-containing protein n=1 Tax=Planococcus sp. 107-1 TaxID=2908840 RepID=UPI001F32D5B1|nr:type II toxin-antitoxin system antitoxin SocA domain-containing protein [Planococcus sp. 107-1]UJF27461.1 DUF4065 domain-containing protein [Planococcus sp. 107-1]
MSEKTAILPNVNHLAGYLHSLKPDISPIKLQKSLYFLYAYHGAFYNQRPTETISEGTLSNNVELFKADFEAWKYGPVIREVYFKKKNNEYNDGNKISEAIGEIEKYPEVKKFIDDLFNQLDSVSDFALVDRSHMDDSWKTAYQKGEVMNKDFLLKEYTEKYVH